MGFLGALGFQGILSLINTLWPIVSATVQVIEKANPQPGNGAQKFNQVTNTVTQVALALPQVANAVQATGTDITDAVHAGDVDKLTSSVGDMVNIAVKLANAAGIFQKSGFVQAVTANQAAAAKQAADFPPGGGG